MCSVPSLAADGEPLKFDVLYHVTAVAVPLAVLLPHCLLLDPYFSRFQQFPESYATSYKLGGGCLAEYYAVSAKSERDCVKPILSRLGCKIIV